MAIVNERHDVPIPDMIFSKTGLVLCNIITYANFFINLKFRD